MMVLSAMQGIFGITITLSPCLPEVYYMVWVCVLFANCGGVFVVTPSAIGRAFGLLNFGVNYGIIFFANVTRFTVVFLVQ